MIRDVLFIAMCALSGWSLGALIGWAIEKITVSKE